jgi:hypothetical protein
VTVPRPGENHYRLIMTIRPWEVKVFDAKQRVPNEKEF